MLKKIGIAIIVMLLGMLLVAQTSAKVDDAQDITAISADTVEMSVKKIKNPDVNSKVPIDSDDITANLFDGQCGKNPFTLESTRDMIDAFHKMTGNLMRNECISKHVLSDDQVIRIQDGKDVYIHASDL